MKSQLGHPAFAPAVVQFGRAARTGRIAGRVENGVEETAIPVVDELMAFMTEVLRGHRAPPLLSLLEKRPGATLGFRGLRLSGNKTFTRRPHATSGKAKNGLTG
jgi:hypothetical protein